MANIFQDEKYDHLDAEEMKKVEKRVEDKFKWYNEKLQQKSNCPLHSNPPVLPNEVLSEKRVSQYCLVLHTISHRCR